MSTQTHFMECTNRDCRFRFPLNLDQFQGKICPVCGSELKKDQPRLAPWQPLWQESHLPELRVLLDNIRSAHNVGSIFRTCEGAGVSRLYLCGLTPSPDTVPGIGKTALGAEGRVNWEWQPNAPDLAGVLREQGCRIVVLEALPEANNLFDVKVRYDERILLVLGSEPAGVDPALAALADERVYIPMAGEKSSLNVSVAAGIALYGLLGKLSLGKRTGRE